MKNPTATTSFSLREFSSADAPRLVELLNSKTIKRDTTMDLPWSLKDAEWWLSFIEYAKSQENITEVHFAVEVEGQLAGAIAVINVQGHKGEMGYWIVDDYAGRKIMTKVIGEMVNYCFNDLGLVRIFAPVLTHNKASARVLEKNGFEREGILKKYYQKDNKFLDAWSYSRVKE